MSGSVTVLPTGAALPETPAHAKTRGKAERTALLTTVRSGLRAVRLADATAPFGTSVHTVAAGLNTGAGASVLQFVPSTLSVQRGDLVAWVVTDPNEPHTITFTSGDQPPEFVEVVPQPDGTVVFAQRHDVFSAVGGTTYTGSGFLNSGQLLGGVRGPLGFVAVIDAPAGDYQYQCLIHREMKGTITVTE